MNSKDTYKFSQVVWAIWRALIVHTSTAHQEPVTRFRSRIKQLLEIDRDKTRIPEIEFLAFSSKPPVNSGTEVRYSIIDTLLIGIAVQLLNVGLKQFDAVYFVKHMKTDFLVPELENILDDLPHVGGVPRQAPDGYDGPIFDQDGVTVIDDRKLLVIPKHEIVERFSRWDSSKGVPLIAIPTICDGLNAMARLLDRELGYQYTNAIILEIGQFSAHVVKFLERAPEFKRGRQ